MVHPIRQGAKLLFVLAVLLAVGFPRLAEDDRRELVIGITQYPSTFHPNIDAMLAKSYVLGMTRRPITVIDADWKLVCMLCTKLPTIENGLAMPDTTPDGKPGMAVTYQIRGDARWGDGTPVSVDDVIFSWEVGKHPKTGVSAQEFYRSLYKIDAKDNKTFTLHFDKRTFDYNDISVFDLLPAHIERPNFTDPAAYRIRTAFDTDTKNPGLYMGPYLMADAVSGSHIVLKRNPKWPGKAPAFDKITVRVIENTAALEANLLSGGIDMIAGELGLSIDQALAFEARHGQKYQVIFKPGLTFEHIDLNLDNPILKDRRVRQALLYALDRQSITDKLFGGKQPVAQTSVNPLDWVHATDIPKYRFDPKKAAELLTAAGWGKTVKGIRVDAKGQPLRFEIMTTAGNRSRELVQQVLQ
ncbi:MAG: peptide ABC transporter substrate-binding protein, partial [Proteobacteria bacterium]|nr:peptide ABC transporter substrate-binding protein [Pseudomonadota bacterium]